MKIGWDFKQVFGKDISTTTSGPVYYTGTPFEPTYYRISLRPYVDTQMYVQSVYNIKFLIYNAITVSIPKFRLNYLLSLIVTNEYWYCPGFGRENEKIQVSIKNTLRFQNCYKKMIESICDRSGAWTGINAKIFQTCS